jgi:predicted RNA-binding Zn-ribbon protein involved in translation (DUF1610 family)
MDGAPTKCSSCGADRGLRPPNAPPTTPCPNCGSTAITVSVTAAATVSLSAAANPSLGLAPPPPGSAWLVHWNYLVPKLALVTGVQPEPMGSLALRRAERDLLGFIENVHQLAAQMQAEGSVLGLPAGAVKAAIEAHPILSLIADVADNHKHARQPLRKRKGQVGPLIGQPVSKHPTPMDPAWTVGILINDRGKESDAADLAREAMECWWSILTGWDLPAQRP